MDMWPLGIKCPMSAFTRANGATSAWKIDPVPRFTGRNSAETGRGRALEKVLETELSIPAPPSHCHGTYSFCPTLNPQRWSFEMEKLMKRNQRRHCLAIGLSSKFPNPCAVAETTHYNDSCSGYVIVTQAIGRPAPCERDSASRTKKQFTDDSGCQSPLPDQLHEIPWGKPGNMKSFLVAMSKLIGWMQHKTHTQKKNNTSCLMLFGANYDRIW